jgi:hypothetical protein
VESRGETVDVALRECAWMLELLVSSGVVGVVQELSVSFRSFPRSRGHTAPKNGNWPSESAPEQPSRLMAAQGDVVHGNLELSYVLQTAVNTCIVSEENNIFKILSK